MKLVRYCPECSHIGEVDYSKHRDCCPDGSHAMQVREEIAIQAKKGFKRSLEKSPDSNVEKNREMLLQRSIAGLAKYGVTTDNNPLTLRAWLQHALEEALDMANYLQAAISKLDNEGGKQ